MSQMATQGINHCITSEIPEGPVKFAFSLYLPESSYVYFTYIMPRFCFFFSLYLVGGIRESMSAPSSQKWKFLNIFKYIHILFYLGFSTYGFSSNSHPKKPGVCLLYCFMLSPVISLGAVPHHHLALSVKELTYSSNS